MNKTIILAIPYIYGLDQCIEKNLRFLGFDVVNLCYDDRDTFYPNFLSRIIGAYQKHFNKNYNYKKKMKFSRYQQEINQKLDRFKHQKADYALCIRANIYPKEIISTIRERSHICVNYQYDGIDRFPDIIEYLTYFDRCLVFDENDVSKYPQCRFEHTTNFYFDFPIQNTTNLEGLYFLGGYEPTRKQHTQTFLHEARKLNLPISFYIYSKDEEAHKALGEEGITYLDRQTVLSFEHNLQKVENCLAVVDFSQFENYGLSFRIFDALHFDKKLITTNKSILKYDFYHPDNILVWDGHNINNLASFLEKPYHPIPKEIKEKYAFSNWIQRTLNIESSTPHKMA